ncbi:MAG: phosphodiesterase [Clostridia bacterium]|nr:phosphodiesterase [Clostridia bacterium]
MRLLIASDIHGSAYYCKMLADTFVKENADRLLLLGDILYHGPRNDLPKDYSPKAVIEILNGLKDKIFCVRGNCDTEVDQMVLQFPILADYCILPVGGKIIYATHGHSYNCDNLPPLQKGDVLLHGHTHIPICDQKENYTYINPGSVSIPKENSPHSFMLLEDCKLLWKNLENGEIYNQLIIQ